MNNTNTEDSVIADVEPALATAVESQQKHAVQPQRSIGLKLRAIFDRTVIAVAIQFYILIAYGFSILVESAIFSLIQRQLGQAITRHEVVSLWYSRLEIGLAFFTMIFAVATGLWFLFSQMRQLYKDLRELED